MTNNNNWIPNKYGIINLWKYDHQEFIPNGGNLYFLGTNGSGKTTTAMLFMPMLLNGVEPKYLSPDKSKKSISDIALGEQTITGLDYRVGYIYGEFINEQTKEIITLGIGIEAKRENNSNDSWYFILKDKYRINDNFSLFTKTEDDKEIIVLDKKELKKQINNLRNKDQAAFFNERKHYKDKVRKLLFQELNQNEFNNYLQTMFGLIKVRLYNNKDDVDISSVIEQLKNTLPEIEANEIKQVSNIIKQAAKNLKEKASMEERSKIVNDITKKYNKYEELYNNIIYNEWYKNYEELKRKEKLLKQKQKTQDELTQKKNKEKERNEQNEKRKEYLTKQLIELQTSYEDSQLVQKRNNLIDDLNDLTNDIQYLEKQIEHIETDQAKQQQKLTKILNLKTENNTQINNYKKQNQKLIELYNLEQLKQTQNYATTINIYKENIDKYEQLQDKKQTLEKEIETITKNKDKIETIVHNAEKELNNNLNEKNKNIELYKAQLNTAFNEINQLDPTQFQLNNEIYRQTLQKINKFTNEHANIDPYIIFESIQNQLNKFTQHYQKSISNLEVQKQNNNSEINSYKKTIESLEQEEYKALPLNACQEKSRKNLKNYITLYEAIDFKEDVPENIKKIIESALLEMNILNAVITTDELTQTNFVHDIKIKKKQTESTFFTSSQTLNDYIIINKTTPKSLTEQIETLLQSIYISEQPIRDFETNAEYTTIYLTGIYHTKDLVGSIDPDYQLKYIGEKTRKEQREIQIQELKNKIKTIESNNYSIKEQIHNKNAKIQVIQSEINALRNTKHLVEYNKNISNINSQTSIINIYTPQLTGLTQSLHDTNTNLIILNNDLEQLIQNVTLNFNNITIKNISAVKNNLNQLLKNYENIAQFEQQNEQYEDQYTEIMEAITEYDERLASQKEIQKEKKNKYKNIEKEINTIDERLKNDEHAKAIDKCKSEIEMLAETINQSNNKLEEWSKQLGKLENNIEDRKNAIEKQKTLTKDWTDLCTTALNQTIDQLLSLNKTKTINNINTNSKNLKTIQKDLYNKIQEYNNTFDHSKLDEEEKILNASDEIEDIYKVKTIITTNPLNDIHKKINIKEFNNEIKNKLNKMNEKYNENQNEGYKIFYRLIIQSKLTEYLQKINEWLTKTSSILADFKTSNGAKIRLVTDKNFKKFEMSLYEIIESINNKDGRFEKRFQKEFKKIFKDAQEGYQNNTSYDVEPIIQNLIDYRKWFELSLEIKEQVNENLENVRANWKPLNKARYKDFSNGERAMISYIVMIALISTQLKNTTANTSPMLKIVLFDEAFAGMDEKHTDNVLSFLNALHINYILTNQKNNISASLDKTNVHIYRFINRNKKTNLIRSLVDNTAF